MLKWIDGHIKGRAENGLLAHLYSYACTRVPPSVKRPDGRSCLRAGNATISSPDRQEGAGGGFVCFRLFVLMLDENTAAFSYLR